MLEEFPLRRIPPDPRLSVFIENSVNESIPSVLRNKPSHVRLGYAERLASTGTIPESHVSWLTGQGWYFESGK